MTARNSIVQTVAQRAIAGAFCAIAVAAYAMPAQARWDNNHYRRDDHHGDHQDNRREFYRDPPRREYYAPPPVVYNQGYYGPGYGYYPPPVVYGPGIGISLPGITIGVH